MQVWIRVCLMLCAFGYFKELRPSDPFLIDYLTGPHRNMSAEEIYQVLFPITTYTTLALIVVTFLLIDVLCYKPFILLCGLSGVTAYSLFAWSTNYASLIVALMLYGTLVATEIAYYTYIYAKVDKEHYQKVTSYTRAAILTGNFCGSVLGQVLIFTDMMDSKSLMYITVGALVTASVCAFFLPPVSGSLYFNRSTTNTLPKRRQSNASDLKPISLSIQKVDSSEVSNERTKISFRKKIVDGLKLLWNHFISAYTQKEVVLWSLWYSLAFGGFGQVRYYIQILWQDIEPDLELAATWNGAVEAALTIFGAAAALVAGHIKIGALHFGLLLLTVCSLLEGVAIFLAANTSTLWVSYVAYISSGALYNFMITYSSYEIAKHLIEDSFGLVFGINTLVALIIQTILTVVVNSEDGLHLPPKSQFTVYGGYFILLGVVYFITATVSYFKKLKIKE